MLKKILFAFVAMVAVSTSALVARDTYSHDASVLPEAARVTIADNFNAQISVVKIDKDLGRVSEYEVVLTDGTEITFDRDGNWDNVEVYAGSAVPAKFVPAGIAEYVKSNHPQQSIIGIDKERGGYEVELSNGIDMKFDKQGKFVHYDD